MGYGPGTRSGTGNAVTLGNRRSTRADEQRAAPGKYRRAKGFKRWGCFKLLRHLALRDGYEQAVGATFARYLHSFGGPTADFL
jgi:hypothetical protein